MYGNKTKILGIGILTAFAVLWCATSWSDGDVTPPASVGDLLGEVTQLQQSIVTLEDSGLINHGRATSLSQKLDRVTQALTDSKNPAAGGDASAEQASFLGELRKAIEALLDFIRELTELITDLPPEVIQPIIDAAIELLKGLLALLIG